MDATTAWSLFGGTTVSVVTALIIFMMKHASLMTRVARIEKDLDKIDKLVDKTEQIAQAITRLETRLDFYEKYNTKDEKK